MGDKTKKRKNMRKLRSLDPMSMISPFIMVSRIGSQNMMTDSVNIAKAEQYVREKQAEGMKNFTLMHLLIASYIRTCAKNPALNRFIRGQRVWTRDDVEIALTIKLEMLQSAPETVVKVTLPKDATAKDVYEALNKVITEYRDHPESDFDTTAKVLSYIPSVIMKFVMWMFKLLDYFGLIPSALTKVSPFHCSFFITSMGSLGIPSIYHHLYEFGTCPAFLSFGAKKRSYVLDSEGNITKQQLVDLSFALDERICDGFYFASSYKYMKSVLKNPWQLDEKPDEVVEDVD